ncbi:hypothetical protein ACMFMG_007196 [Clarireedia jacksonii]
MAGPSSISTIPNTPVQARYRHVESPAQNNTRLPEGQCNFTNLNHGTRCGCRRFWNQSQGGMGATIHGDGSFSDRSQVCMCEHHACYHDDHLGSTGVQQTRALSNVSTINVDAIGRMAQVNRQPSTPPLVKIPAAEEPDSDRQCNDAKLQSTLQWSRFVRSGSSLGDIPSIPSECILPSDPASRGSSHARYTRPFGGLGLGTLDHIPRISTQAQSMQSGKGQQVEAARPMRAYQDIHGQTHLQSVTEIISPSLRPTQDPGLPNDLDDPAQLGGYVAETKIKSVDAGVQVQLIDIDVAQAPLLTPGNKGQKHRLMDLDKSDDQLIPKLRRITEEFPIIKHNHADRISALENASFSNSGYEEVQECQETLGTRIYELEERVEEIEKANDAADDSTVCGNRHLNESIDSHASRTSTVDLPNLTTRVESLEAQIFEIQTTLPPVLYSSFGDGCGIFAIWYANEGHLVNKVNSCASEDWTQTQHSATIAALSRQDHSVSWEETVFQAGDNDASWLLPRACSAQGKIDQRLRSRGLVKKIQIRGPDARDVQLAMMAAFGDLPGILAEDPFAEHRHSKLKVPQALTDFLGLRATWIPLRKLHKDSCLKFLNTSEMVTPALWTVPFISSGVAMRAKYIRRLYVTQADSYIQHLGGTRTTNWTWQKLRQLPRVYEDGMTNHTPEGDAKELCWEWDERLDPPPSPQASFASQPSQSLSIRIVQDAHDLDPASQSDHFSSAAVTPLESTPPTSIAPSKKAPLFPVKDKNPFRPLRTSSMSALPSVVTTQVGKRRKTSFGPERESSPVRNRKVANMKRRRVSRSPSRPRDSLTWSIGPPSSIASLVQEVADIKRGTTPFAYATPHSNDPYVEPASRSANQQEVAEDNDGGSTTDEFSTDFAEQNAMSDFDPVSGDEHDNHEEPWEGVEEDEAHAGGAEQATTETDTKQADDGDEGDENDHHEEPWEGVEEDEAHAGDAEQATTEMDTKQADDGDRGDQGDQGDESDTSSTPSEYPSKQKPKGYRKGAAFYTHADEDFDDELGK